MHGEKSSVTVRLCMFLGSPPHARGKGPLIGEQLIVTGITPACAGKRRIGYASNYFIEDHPRMRGEKPTPGRAPSTTIGSPPHARGKAVTRRQTVAGAGITPACAGKSPSIIAPQLPQRDHPRMRGEKVSIHCHVLLSMGSPPHARGKVKHCQN